MEYIVNVLKNEINKQKNIVALEVVDKMHQFALLPTFDNEDSDREGKRVQENSRARERERKN